MNSEEILNTGRSMVTHKVAISNQKGGVAKTTTTLSLGASLADSGYSVLLVDLDPQGHLTQALGVSLRSVRHTVGDVLLNQATLIELSLKLSDSATFNNKKISIIIAGIDIIKPRKNRTTVIRKKPAIISSIAADNASFPNTSRNL